MTNLSLGVVCRAGLRLALCAAVGLQGCGGSGPDSEAKGASGVPGTSPDLQLSGTATMAPAAAAATVAAVATVDNCLVVPARVASAAGQRSVAEFGAVPNDSGDDTAAIQRALDALQAGQTLVFPAGRYLTNKRLRVRVPGTSLDGTGATLHATNPDDQAIMIEADDIAVRSFFLTAVTDVRRSAPWHARIAVYSENADGSLKTIRRSVIQDNTVTHAGAPGSPGANGASAGGIILLHADGFLVAGNTVVRTLSDGIHVTGGSRNGRVLGNTVRETGDDMIAVVSYAGVGNAALGTAAQMSSQWATRVANKLNQNILIANNNVSGQYWGRGITVVGGEAITIRGNTLDNIPLSAGILLAREANYESFGVNNVMVADNTITNVQNLPPPYDVGGKYASHNPTGHGAVEIHASLFDDEKANAQLKEAFSVRNVKLIGNIVRVTAVPGVRAGVPFDNSVTAVNPSTGVTVSRHMTTSVVQSLSVQTGRFDSIPGQAISLGSVGMATGELHCRGNTRDGLAYTPAACLRVEPAVTGASMTCLAAGQVM